MRDAKFLFTDVTVLYTYHKTDLVIMLSMLIRTQIYIPSTIGKSCVAQNLLPWGRLVVLLLYIHKS